MSAAVLNDDESVFITENSLPLDTKEETTSDTAIQAEIATVDDSPDEDEKLRIKKAKKKKRKSKKKYKYRRKSVSSSEDSGTEYDDKEAKKKWENLYYEFQKIYYKNNGHYYTDGSTKFIKNYYKKHCLSNNNDGEEVKSDAEIVDSNTQNLDNNELKQPLSPEEVLSDDEGVPILFDKTDEPAKPTPIIPGSPVHEAGANPSSFMERAPPGLFLKKSKVWLVNARFVTSEAFFSNETTIFTVSIHVSKTTWINCCCSVFLCSPISNNWPKPNWKWSDILTRTVIFFEKLP